MSTLSVSCEWKENLNNNIWHIWLITEELENSEKHIEQVFMYATKKSTNNPPVSVMFGTHGEAIAWTFDLILCRTEVPACMC